MKVKHIVSIICLTVGGLAALYYDEIALAGACFGAIASWGLVNGVRNAKETN